MSWLPHCSAVGDSGSSFNAPQEGMFFWAHLTGLAMAKRQPEFINEPKKMVAFGPQRAVFAHEPNLSTLRLSFAFGGRRPNRVLPPPGQTL
jgi:DNA-binding transcriptional MocR family regulator